MLEAFKHAIHFMAHAAEHIAERFGWTVRWTIASFGDLSIGHGALIGLWHYGLLVVLQMPGF